MTETSEIRIRLRETIKHARQAAAERRQMAQTAEEVGTRVLASVATPVFKTVASALKAEGYPFRLFTPAAEVRLASEKSGDQFIGLELDTARDTPALVGRVSRLWGQRVLVDERVVREGDEIGALTKEDVITFLLESLAPFVER